MINLNSFYISDAVKFMQENMDDNFVDLTITSPPYDTIREYNGYHFNYQTMIKELYRVTKNGGIVVWIVGDETINGSETGTSFKQALHAIETGFNLHDTMIWKKHTFTAVGALKTRYAPIFDYMFVFSKGKVKTFNPIKDRKNKWEGTKVHGNIRQKNGGSKPVSNNRPIKEFGQRYNIWEIANVGIPGNKHPATFPEQIANDHIISWSNEEDIVFDPMCGSGTVCKMAFLNNRNFIGIDVSEEYINQIAIPRLESIRWNKNTILLGDK